MIVCTVYLAVCNKRNEIFLLAAADIKYSLKRRFVFRKKLSITSGDDNSVGKITCAGYDIAALFFAFGSYGTCVYNAGVAFFSV